MTRLTPSISNSTNKFQWQSSTTSTLRLDRNSKEEYPLLRTLDQQRSIHKHLFTSFFVYLCPLTRILVLVWFCFGFCWDRPSPQVDIDRLPTLIGNLGFWLLVQPLTVLTGLETCQWADPLSRTKGRKTYWVSLRCRPPRPQRETTTPVSRPVRHTRDHSPTGDE